MKRYLTIALLLFLFTMIAACGTTDVEEEDTSSSENEQEEVEESEDEETEEETEEDQGEQDDEENAEDESSEDDEAEVDGDKVKEQGTYNGQADPHTVEIETEEGPFAYQLSMDARELVEDITEGSKVEFTYTEDGDQRTIEDIVEVE